MEGERKKRKMAIEDYKEEEDEEKKIEKFFALIRSTREVRDRLRRGLNEEKEKEEKKVQKKATAIWYPTFQPEDFMEDSKSRSLGATPAGPSKSEGKGKEEKVKEPEEADEGGKDLDLDLNLSL